MTIFEMYQTELCHCPGNPTRYSDLSPAYPRQDDETPSEYFATPDILGYCPSNGGPVKRANVDKFLELYGDRDGVFHLHTHDSEQIAIRGDVDDPGIIQCLAALADYCAIDDCSVSEKTQEMIEEAWDNYAGQEFHDALVEWLDEHDEDLARAVEWEDSLDEVSFDKLPKNKIGKCLSECFKARKDLYQIFINLVDRGALQAPEVNNEEVIFYLNL